MKTKIFEISTSPIAKADRINSGSLLGQIVGLGSYVMDSENRRRDIQMFMATMQGVFEPAAGCRDAISLLPGGRIDYFRTLHMQYREAAEKMSQIPLEVFCGMRNDMEYLSAYHVLEDPCTERGKFYIFEDEELYAMDNWMRSAEAGIPYYIGGTLNLFI